MPVSISFCKAMSNHEQMVYVECCKTILYIIKLFI